MFHEVAHGLVANWMGDDTAKRQGRLAALNPLDHLDPLGTLCMVFFGFGWAKPVPVNPSRFKRPKLGMTLAALAGPVANLSAQLCPDPSWPCCSKWHCPGNGVALAVAEFFLQTGILSVGLGVFNLIPIPPLDGCRVLQALLPEADFYYKFFNYQVYFQIALLVLLFLGALNGLVATLQIDMLNLIIRGVSGLLGLFGVV